MKRYLSILDSITETCEEFKLDTISSAFTDHSTKALLKKPNVEYYCFTPRFQGRLELIHELVEISDLFGISGLETNKKGLIQRVNYLTNPWAISEKYQFEMHIDYITKVFSGVQADVKKMLSVLKEEEKERLEEALNCYLQDCHYSTIVMSVSAIEFRLLDLMQSIKPDPKLEKYTLGGLITEYLDNKPEYKNVIPEKHEPLLELCNTYRIFSVHPKKERITRQITTSIINMAFAFLLDEELVTRTHEAMGS
jgi:hypothetical protein